MINLKTLLTELVVRDLTTGDTEGKYKHIIVYKGNLFILDGGSNLDPVKFALKDHPEAKHVIDTEDMYDMLSSIADAGSDILVGNWYPDKGGLVVWNSSEIIPLTSLNVKKAAKELGATTITYQHGEDKDIDIPTRKLMSGQSKKMFHGTASDQLRKILKFGLDPGRGPSRFAHRGIQHTEYIYFAATFQTCGFYAEHAVRISENPYSNFPIIIEIEVPDPNLLVPDFDADMSTTEKPYYPYGKRREVSPMKSMGISRETGKWGYKGRIPARFIKWVYYFNTYQKKWHRSRPDVWRRLLFNYDWETISYKLGMDNFLEPPNPYAPKTSYWQ